MGPRKSVRLVPSETRDVLERRLRSTLFRRWRAPPGVSPKTRSTLESGGRVSLTIGPSVLPSVSPVTP